MENLSLDTIASILEFLDTPSIVLCFSINKKFYSISKRDSMWKYMIEKRYGRGAKLGECSTWKELFFYLHPASWKWDILKTHPAGLQAHLLANHIIGEEGKLITSREVVSMFHAVLDRELDFGVHFWEIEFDSLPANSAVAVLYDVNDPVIQASGFLYRSVFMYINGGGLHIQNGYGNYSHCESVYGIPGITIGILLDVENRRTYWFVNNQVGYTETFEGICTGKFYPAVLLQNASCRIKRSFSKDPTEMLKMCKMQFYL
eukprot:TRINITY_DN14776_c0_g1_i1.p1 TRINITY_DN14776_c0_g1~~TRINITY_DN14776_c0_g1_i1.p1  ORF type:complete len:260 (-),score=46.03 TRINITY_DN14776_c0_g1_i1:126-905(-)